MSRLFYYVVPIAFMLCSSAGWAQFSVRPIENAPSSKALNYAMEGQGSRFWEQPFTFGDGTKKMLHATWAELNMYQGGQFDSSFIYYSVSNDKGNSWQRPKRISFLVGTEADSTAALKGARGCLGPEGEIYIAWAGPKGLLFQCSQDGGKTWLPTEKIIGTVKNGWSYSVNGSASNGLPSVACDPGKNDHPGRIYACWGDEKYGEKNKDVLLIYSGDKGENWTEPILVTYRPNHKEQFRPAMAMDESDGRLYLLYFDRQNYVDADSTDLYLAVSDNGGLLFETYRLNEKPILINAGILLENSITSTAPHRAEAIWTQSENDKTASFKATITDSALEAYKKTADSSVLKVEKAFAFADKVKVNFSTGRTVVLDAVITKPLDPNFEKVIFRSKKFPAGDQSFLIATKKLELPKGNYILTLYYGRRNTYVWILDE